MTDQFVHANKMVVPRLAVGWGYLVNYAFWTGLRAGQRGAFADANPWIRGRQAYAWERGREEGSVAWEFS